MEVTFRSVYKALLKHWKIIVISFLILVILGAILPRVIFEKKYSSEAFAIIEIEKDQGSSSYVTGNTNINKGAIIAGQSEEVINKVLSKLKDRGLDKYLVDDVANSISLVEYAGMLHIKATSYESGAYAQSILSTYLEVFSSALSGTDESEGIKIMTQKVGLIVFTQPSISNGIGTPNTNMYSLIIILGGTFFIILGVLSYSFVQPKYYLISDAERELKIKKFGKVLTKNSLKKGAK